MPFEMVNCTQQLLREIGDRSVTRRDVAQTYALALRSSAPTDWPAVNQAILPTEAVTQTFALLARRGAGKTYAAKVLAEEMLGAGFPIVALDQTGAWWGLRAGADGDPKGGFPVVIMGGAHADVPLEPTGGS